MTWPSVVPNTWLHRHTEIPSGRNNTPWVTAPLILIPLTSIIITRLRKTGWGDAHILTPFHFVSYWSIQGAARFDRTFNLMTFHLKDLKVRVRARVQVKVRMKWKSVVEWKVAHPLILCKYSLVSVPYYDRTSSVIDYYTCHVTLWKYWNGFNGVLGPLVPTVISIN